MGCGTGAWSRPGVPVLCPTMQRGWVADEPLMVAWGEHWVFEHLWGSFGPFIFSPKALRGVSPELIWASTMPGGESATLCKA